MTYWTTIALSVEAADTELFHLLNLYTSLKAHLCLRRRWGIVWSRRNQLATQ